MDGWMGQASGQGDGVTCLPFHNYNGIGERKLPKGVRVL